MSKIDKNSGFQPTLNPRFQFDWKGSIHAVVEMTLVPDTPALTMIAAKCPCTNADCSGWTPVDADVRLALPMMGKVISLLLDERDALEAHTEPSAN